MKKLIIAALMLTSISAFAQPQPDDTVLVTVDVGGCVNAKIMTPQDMDGDEWELQLIPVDKNGKDIVGKMQKVLIESQVDCVVGSHYYNERINPAIGPEMQASIQVQPNQLFRVQLVEKDWGMHYILGGGHEEYSLGLFSPKMIDKNQDFVKGKALHNATRDCLKMKKI